MRIIINAYICACTNRVCATSNKCILREQRGNCSNCNWYHFMLRPKASTGSTTGLQDKVAVSFVPKAVTVMGGVILRTQHFAPIYMISRNSWIESSLLIHASLPFLYYWMADEDFCKTSEHSWYHTNICAILPLINSRYTVIQKFSSCVL